jgi:hypothetical protein
MMRSPLYLTNTRSWIFHSASSLKQLSADRNVATLENIILIPSQLFLLNNACLVEKQQIQMS